MSDQDDNEPAQQTPDPAAPDSATSDSAASDSAASDPAAEELKPKDDKATAVVSEVMHADHPALVTLLAIVAAVIVGSILVVASDPATHTAISNFGSDPWGPFRSAGKVIWSTYTAIFEGAILDPSTLDSGSRTAILGPISETIVNATPLILAGLSVTLAFRAGMFNIGAQGQMIISAVFAAYVGFTWHLPIGIALVVAVVAAMLGGSLWAGIAGWLKAKTGAHEVITTIMLNYVALYLVRFFLAESWFKQPGQTQAISRSVRDEAQFPLLLGSGLRANTSFLVAIAATALVWWLLSRSTIGFRLRAVGANQNAARTAGMSVARTYFTVMVIVGALAGLAGAAQILGTAVNNQVTDTVDAGFGFDAITVALLGRGNAWGTFFAGLLFGALRAGAVQLQTSTSVPTDLVQILQSLIVLFIAAPGLIRLVFRLRASGGDSGAMLAKGWNG